MNEYKKILKKKYLINSKRHLNISYIYKINLIINLTLDIINNINIFLIIKFLVIPLNIYLIIFNSYNSNLELSYLKNEVYNIKRNNEIISHLKNKIIKKFNSYISKCLKNRYKSENNYKYMNKTKISVIMPLYNAENYLKYSLSSIQNQNLKEIEIILIDDFSRDNTLLEVEKYINEDKRIRIIKNEQNRKILYSKSIAALNANSKYIIQLDQDDMLIRDDIFDILYYEAELNNLDLVQIRDIYIDKFKLSKNIRVNIEGMHFIFKTESYDKSYQEMQPDLKYNMFLNGNIYLLWGLLIKTDIYKKAIYHLWPLIINYQLVYYEDYIITSLIVIFSNKYKYLNNFGLIHLNHNNSAMTQYLDQFFISVLFCQNNLYLYYIKDHPEDIKIIINFISRYKRIYKMSYELYPKFISYNFRNILKNEYLSKNDTEFLLKELDINYTQFEKWNGYEYFMNYSEYENIYNFQYLCGNSSLNNIIIYSKPKISIILYCVEYKYLEKTINSIINQKYISFEIILIYDNNDYNNFCLIKKIVSKYNNIIVINNKTQKGILKSYSLGVLSSKGEYVLLLKSGETLAKEDILNELYFTIYNKSYDILEFNLLINNKDDIKENTLSLYKCQHIKSDINITDFKFNKKYKDIDQEKELITNKLIKSNLFKKIIIKYRLNEYKNKIYIYYDEIIIFLLSKENVKYEYKDFFGIIKYINIIKLLYINKIKTSNHKLKDSIFYINFLFDNVDNKSKEIKFLFDEFYNLLSIIYNKYNRSNKESIKLLKKFLNCEKISKFNKKNLIFLYNSLIN